MRRAEIEEQNRHVLERQRQFRMTADVVTEAWMAFDEVQAVAVIGSVAKALWKEIPRFREFRREGIEIWHECSDLDLALWINSQGQLDTLRRAADRALREAFATGIGISTAAHQLDTFLFEPESDRYLGRLCSFNQCPKGKKDCLVPGCGTIPFNKRIADFRPHDDILASARDAMLYERGRGRLRSALELPGIDDGGAGRSLTSHHLSIREPH
jgi:hypothetical protein